MGSRRSLRGAWSPAFTLIEVLVVVAIAGLLVVAAAVNLFPGAQEVAHREAGRLALGLEAARDDAWFGGRPVAVSLEDSRLRRWRLGRDRTWAADVEQEQRLGEALAVRSLVVDGETLPPATRLVFLPDGYGVPFRIEVEVRGVTRWIEGDALGAVRLEPLAP